MKIYVPDYYNEFQCIADRCTHNCCIGWEIDIDDETLAYYRSDASIPDTVFADKISIDENGTAYFKMGDNGRCPFLNDSGLCKLILNFGEDALCQICADHPRFRNYYNDRIEMGLGLACEEAARIILTRRKPTRMVLLYDEEDAADDSVLSYDANIMFNPLTERDNVLRIVHLRAQSFYSRIIALQHRYDFTIMEDCAEIIRIYRTLERFDDEWTVILDEIEQLYMFIIQTRKH